MTITPTHCAALAIFGTLFAALPPAASAQTSYPNKPIRLVIGFPAGGGADNTARLYGDEIGRAHV